MRRHFILFFLSTVLCAQETVPSSPKAPEIPQFQESATLNDERVKVFVEIESKANGGDAGALLAIGSYYMHGQFPVNQNESKAEQYWSKGASIGSDECASRMYRSFNKGTTSEAVIERTKWAMISHRLLSLKRGYAQYEFKRPEDVSESSFAEATKRAQAFLNSSSVGVTSSAASAPVQPKRSPALKFGSLSLFDDYRRKICADYMKAALPIYNKGDAATESEKESFSLTASELVRLQAYVGKKYSHPLVLNSTSNSALWEINNRKLEDLYAKISAADIKTSTPATRTELNEASKFINALGQLMQLPVVLNTY